MTDELAFDTSSAHFIEISQVNIPFTIKNITENETITVSPVGADPTVFTLLPGTYSGSDITERFSAWTDRNDLEGSLELFFDSCVDRTCVRFDSKVRQLVLSERLRVMFGYDSATLARDPTETGDYSEFISEGRPLITDDILEFFITTNLNTNSYTDCSSDDTYSTLTNVLFHGYFNSPNTMNTFNSTQAMPVEISSDSIGNFNLYLVDSKFNPLTPGLPWTVFFTIM
ncbi:hypothetical protein KIPB_003313 [Kipferlia bialata]|uniref:Uncharacterized protein n=1 Tax=Kipferlia bialata TaxID=797122 RepID=A0A391NJY3_9EUKA|nr:hypothetical protein KIPB_003313 [Kipferlia bialata]|eukprot:g3313.t1